MAQGVVSKVIAKDFNGKLLYSFALKNQQNWFNLGDHAPQFKEGDSVQFDVVTKGTRLHAQNVAPWTGGGAEQAPPIQAFAGRPNGNYTRKPFVAGKSEQEKEYWANKDAKQEETQRRIEIQAARNAAIETAALLLSHNLVAVPASITKKADGKGYVSALINELLDEYLSDTSRRLGGAPVVEDTPPADSNSEGTWE
jgi:hypothetical protein